jgi:Ca-activated chloride channel family protein
MSFIWPQLLLAVLLVPIGVLLYRALDGRRRRAVVAVGLGTGSGTVRRRLGARTRIPAVLFVAGLTVLMVALARPQATLDLPRQEGTVILAFDVSGSMAATDLKPTRMEAAKAATQAFVARQPAGVVVGVVAFSDAGLAVQAPTNDQSAVLGAIQRLSPTRGTSLAQGITAALSSIETTENPPPTDYYTNRTPAPTVTPAPVPAGSDSAAVIILLTDGENTQPPDPTVAVQAAANRGVRIDTVGIGSPAGTILTVNGFKVHTQLDEAALRQISATTGGTYFNAQSADDLTRIYDALGSRLTVKPQDIEVTGLFAGGAILLLGLGGALSLAWLGRLP